MKLTCQIWRSVFDNGFGLPLMVLFALLFLPLTGCGVKQPETIAENPPDLCVIDSVNRLRRVPTVPACSGSVEVCRRKCLGGDASFCVGLAYAIEQDPSSKNEAVSLYRRACAAGLAIACTNYGASLWVKEKTAEEVDCARKIFTRSCEAGESFACGMAGREMAEKATSKDDLASARAFLELKCEKLGGFPCRILAKHIEEGDFGPAKPGEVKKLLKQACEGGDPNGCGDPKNAVDTFN